MTARGGGRPGRPVDHELRSAILAATGQLLRERGYDGITMDAIAGRAGAARQTLYRVWGSKGEVVADAVLQGAFVLDVGPVPDTGDLRADLTTWLSAVAGYLDRPGVGSLIRALAAASTGREGRTMAFDRVVVRPVREIIVRRLDAARESGEWVARVPGAVVADLVIGYLALASLGGAPHDDDRARDLVAVIVAAPAPERPGAEICPR